MGLTDNLRAAVFARDKAVYSFSGLSLWLLDHGTAPFVQPLSRHDAGVAVGNTPMPKQADGLKSLIWMVGATGIEPVTPSMSTRCSPAELRALRP